MLKLRYLRLRSITAKQTFGVDLAFDGGLNILRAGNTSGKSTCLQAIIFALGLERSLGPNIAIPLPYAMRERIQVKKHGDYLNVLESYVELEIENAEGQVLTIRRDAVGKTNPKLIRTWPGARLSEGNQSGERRDYFVHDAGASQREDGFHTKLGRFLGWNLPEVTKFDGSDCPLYMETIFPMFFVEQKRGWSALQGPLPTFFGIQDLVRRVMEFLLDLDAGKIRRERAELRRDVTVVEQEWKRQISLLEDKAGFSFRFRGLQDLPTAEFANSGEMELEIFEAGEWKFADEVAKLTRTRISELERTEIPSTETAVPEIEKELGELRERATELTAIVETVQYEFSSQHAEKKEVEQRIASLNTDLLRNQDAQKLQKLGSDLGFSLTEHRCPTCHQDVNAELLPSTSTVAMAIDENIAFLKSQIDLYRSTQRGLDADLEKTRAEFHTRTNDLRRIQARVRELRQALLQPSSSPSRARIEEIIQLQGKADRLNSLQQTVDGATEELTQLAEKWTGLKERQKEIAGGDFSVSDRQKITDLSTSIRKYLEDYGFTSFHADEIYLSEDNFRPIVKVNDEEGEVVEKELGFEVSASDYIRIKWAYYRGLLALARDGKTNHPNLLVFDEPGQQETEIESVTTFLKTVSTALGSDQQVLVATSENLDTVRQAVGDAKANILNFDGFILRPINSSGLAQ